MKITKSKRERESGPVTNPMHAGFVPLIHAAHAASLAGSQAPPPAAVARIITDARNNYDAWAAEDHRLHSGVAAYQPVPSWEETIRAIPAPLAGWPPFIPHYIGPSLQESVLGLRNDYLPHNIFHVHRWVENGGPIVGWSQFCVPRDTIGRRIGLRRTTEVVDVPSSSPSSRSSSASPSSSSSSTGPHAASHVSPSPNNLNTGR